MRLARRLWDETEVDGQLLAIAHRVELGRSDHLGRLARLGFEQRLHGHILIRVAAHAHRAADDQFILNKHRRADIQLGHGHVASLLTRARLPKHDRVERHVQIGQAPGRALRGLVARIERVLRSVAEQNHASQPMAGLAPQSVVHRGADRRFASIGHVAQVEFLVAGQFHRRQRRVERVELDIQILAQLAQRRQRAIDRFAEQLPARLASRFIVDRHALRSVGHDDERCPMPFHLRENVSRPQHRGDDRQKDSHSQGQ